MVDDDGERLDWGNDDDEQQNPSEQFAGYSPRQSTGGYAGAPEDAEDAISLGGDDEDEREYYAHHSEEQASSTHLAKQSSFASHSSRREGQRLSAATPSRTPSRAKNSESPTRDSRPPNSTSSTGKLPLAPLTHALPPKPVLVPPLFEQPSEPGILASTMVNRPRKSNGAAKGHVAPDDGDALPSDREIRYSTSGSEPYYNIHTEEPRWNRPRPPVTSGRSSPTKNRENGSAQLSGRRSPAVQDNMWAERTGRNQQPRPARRDMASRRASPPPNSALSYADRHYRPREATETVNTGQSYYADATHGRGRSSSPVPASEGRRKTRSASPQWDRRGRRDVSASPPPDRGIWRDAQRDYDYSQDRQAGKSDSGWSRSQEYPEPLSSAPRSPSTRRGRRQDDIEPPRHRKEDLASATRRKDDIEHRRRKDDIEPRLRRKDDIEPPLRLLPSKEPSSRHVNDEWPGSRPRSPPPHLRESSPSRRANPPFPSSLNADYPAMASSSSREASRYERINSPPPPRYQENLTSDSLSLRRGRDPEMSDPGFDNSKRRRLNNDFGSSRRGPADLVAPIASLPPKPMAGLPAYEAPQVDPQHRKRAPLPPQREQWIRSDKPPAHVQPSPQHSSEQRSFSSRPIRNASPNLEPNGMSQGNIPEGPVIVHPTNTMPPGYRGRGDIPLYDTPPGRINAIAGLPNAWERPPHKQNYSTPRLPDVMDVDAAPPARVPPASRTDMAPRNGIGGMYSDRMPASAPQEAPRAPRAMVPRDGGSYPAPSTSLSNMYGRAAEPPVHDGPGSLNRGRPQPRSPVEQRRWGEGNPADRRVSYSGPNTMEPPLAPPTQVMRDLPERPKVIGRAPNAELRGRGRPVGDVAPRPPPRMSATSNVPVGPRTVNPFEPVQAVQPPAFHATDNGYGSRRTFPDERGEDVPDSYGKKPMRYAPPPSDEPFPDRSRAERGSERGARRPSVSDPMRGPPDERQPSRGGTSPIQSRHGPAYPSSQSEPSRLWQTRDEAQNSRISNSRSHDDIVPREPRQYGRSAYEYEPPRVDKAMTPREEERSAAVKVHPDRARLLAVPTPSSQDSMPSGFRGRRPGSERFYMGDRDSDDRVRDTQAPPDDSRMGPPRDISPQNGYRPNVKRGGSLLERLNIHDSPPHEGASSLRERVEVVHASVEGDPVDRAEMHVDSEGLSGPVGDDASRGSGGGRGTGKRRTGKPRRGRRNGAP